MVAKLAITTPVYITSHLQREKQAQISSSICIISVMRQEILAGFTVIYGDLRFYSLGKD